MHFHPIGSTSGLGRGTGINERKDEMRSNVWLITGAGRGLGLNIAKAALAAGHKVVATGRNTEKVQKPSGSPKTSLS